ncbi:MAG: ABC transporter substrate-binding protein [Myxococcota bacterium]
MSVAALSLLLAAAPAPKDWVEDRIEEARALANRPAKSGTEAGEAWRADADGLIQQAIDWDRMVSASLGRRRWSELSEPQKKAFGKLLRSLIEASYRSKLRLALEKKEEREGDLRIEWLEESVEEDEAELEALVHTRGRSIGLVFHLVRTPEAWKMWDLETNGMSTVRTYKSEFREQIRNGGWEGLMGRLRAKLEEVESGKGEFIPSADR